MLHIKWPKKHIAIEASHYACPPVADPNDDFPAKMFFYPADLAREGTINEWVVSDNWRGRNFNFDGALLPMFQNVLDAGAEITIWMNDIFSPTGGDAQTWATPEQVEDYLRRFLASKINSASIHEADFLETNPQAPAIWKVLKNLFGP